MSLEDDSGEISFEVFMIVIEGIQLGNEGVEAETQDRRSPVMVFKC